MPIDLEVKPKQRQLPDYIEKVQKDVTATMRGVLVDWLVEVAEEYKLISLKRFTSLSTGRSFSSWEFLLCLLLRSMKRYVRLMEADILLALQFELGRPIVHSFISLQGLHTKISMCHTCMQLEPLCCYLSELTILYYKAVKFGPSMLAASAVFLARFIIRPKQHPWNQMLEEYTKYKPADLQECVGI